MFYLKDPSTTFILPIIQNEYTIQVSNLVTPHSVEKAYTGRQICLEKWTLTPLSFINSYYLN